MAETIKTGKNFSKGMKKKKRIEVRSSHSMRTRSKPIERSKQKKQKRS